MGLVKTWKFDYFQMLLWNCLVCVPLSLTYEGHKCHHFRYYRIQSSSRLQNAFTCLPHFWLNWLYLKAHLTSSSEELSLPFHVRMMQYTMLRSIRNILIWKVLLLWQRVSWVLFSRGPWTCYFHRIADENTCILVLSAAATAVKWALSRDGWMMGRSSS